MQWSWCAHWNGTKWYAVRRDETSGKIIKMHKVLFSVEVGFEVDHVNGDSLDNQMSNFRQVTRAQNLQNRVANKNSTSQFVGVYWENWSSRWVAAIKKDGHTTKVGRFKSEHEAAVARDKAALRIFGPHAKMNVL